MTVYTVPPAVMASRHAATVCSLVLALAALQVSSYPVIWYQGAIGLGPYNQAGCLGHPNADVGGPSPHGAPTADASISFTLRAASTSNVVAEVCPGEDYTIAIGFPASRAGLLTTSQGSFGADATGADCPNRAALGGEYADNRQASYTLPLSVPCNATGLIEVKVTSASAEEGYTWKQNSAFLFVNPACPSTACGTTASEPPAPPANPLAPPPPSPVTPGSPEFLVESPPEDIPSPPPRPEFCTPSTRGYGCMGPLGDIMIHWSVNTTAPPVNDCTGTSSVALTEEEVADVGVIHFLAEAQNSGWVGVSFPLFPGIMIPADAVIGYVDDATGNGFVNSYRASAYRRPDVNPVNQSDSWAYNRGVVQQGSTTAICFSRRIREPRTTAVQLDQSLAITGGLVDMNWAMSPFDILVKHTDKGSGIVDLTYSPPPNAPPVVPGPEVAPPPPAGVPSYGPPSYGPYYGPPRPHYGYYAPPPSYGADSSQTEAGEGGPVRRARRRLW